MAKLPKKEIYTELESGGKIRKAEILLEEQNTIPTLISGRHSQTSFV